MNIPENTFSLTGFSAEAFLPYAFAGATEKTFSYAAKFEASGWNCSSCCTELLGTHSFMMTIDVTMDTLYHLSLDAMRRLNDAVFTVVGFCRQQGANVQRQVKRFAAKVQTFVSPMPRRVVNLRL